MSGEKEKISKLCLVGFVLSIMPAIYMVLGFFSNLLPRSLNIDFIERFLPVALIVCPLAGLIVSIAGVVSVRRSGKRGKSLGITGIALPGIALVVITFVFVPVLFNALLSSSGRMNNEMNSMGKLGEAVNTEYDVSQYRLYEGYDFTDLTVSEEELNTYAKDKLQVLDSGNYRSIKGTYQDYNFLIIRSDKLDVWLSFNRPSGFEFYKGYATIYYEEAWEIAATRPVALDVYKDPSDRFIVITNCSDYKVISEFFG